MLNRVHVFTINNVQVAGMHIAEAHVYRIELPTFVYTSFNYFYI